MNDCPCGGTSPADWCDACAAAAEAYQSLRAYDGYSPFVSERHAKVRGLAASLAVYGVALLVGLWVVSRVAEWLAGVLTWAS